MWVGRRGEGERECRARREHGPVGRRVEPVAPSVRALNLAAVEVNHRRAELGGRDRAARHARYLGRGG